MHRRAPGTLPDPTPVQEATLARRTSHAAGRLLRVRRTPPIHPPHHHVCARADGLRCDWSQRRSTILRRRHRRSPNPHRVDRRHAHPRVRWSVPTCRRTRRTVQAQTSIARGRHSRGTAVAAACFTSAPTTLTTIRVAMSVGAAFVMLTTLSIITASFRQKIVPKPWACR